MNILEALLLGAVQGFTEFLPVSSSGHLYLVETYLGFVPSLSLELWLHLGSLVAVVAYFWRDLWKLVLGTMKAFHKKVFTPEADFVSKLLAATLLTFPTAYATKKFVIDSELSLALVGWTLLVTAGLIVLSEYFRPEEERSFSWSVVVILGLIQGFSLLPGISRSGLTIALLLLLGVKRELAAKTSFFLSIPTIAGAGLYAYVDSSATTDMQLSVPIILAVATSALVAYMGIRWMMKLVEGKWIYFAPYCLVLGLLLVVLS